jgi:hypothetical protein
LAAALTAFNPLLAHYTVFVKQYSLDFLPTALLVLSGAWMLDGREVDPRTFARVSMLSGLGIFLSVTSVFMSVPLTNIIALRAWFARYRHARSILWAAAVADLFVLWGYFVLRNRAAEHIAGIAPKHTSPAEWAPFI